MLNQILTLHLTVAVAAGTYMGNGQHIRPNMLAWRHNDVILSYTPKYISIDSCDALGCHGLHVKTEHPGYVCTGPVAPKRMVQSGYF